MTDIEMNGTVRGAVEQFHLCTNLCKHDALFAECIRTFAEHTLDGRSWMTRLETSQLQKAFINQSVETYIPPTFKPNVRTDRSRPNEFEAYGFRPLRHPWKLLSAYEFLRHWRVDPLLVPSYYKNKGAASRTAWTREALGAAGLRKVKTC